MVKELNIDASIEVATSNSSLRVIRVTEQLIELHGHRFDAKLLTKIADHCAQYGFPLVRGRWLHQRRMGRIVRRAVRASRGTTLELFIYMRITS